MTGQPHDTLFKAALSRPENALGALRAVLPPALLTQLDLTTLKLSPRDTHIDDAALAQLFSDLVYEVQLAGRPALVCFVLYEHQSIEDALLIVASMPTSQACGAAGSPTTLTPARSRQ